MDAALAPRVYHTAAPLPLRADVTPVPAAVPTLLPQPSQSVAALAEQSASSFDGNRARARAELPHDRLSDDVLREIEREIEFRDETNDLVVKRLDSLTGEVLSQFPAESLLKLRAYVQQEMSKSVGPFLARSI